MAKTPIGNFIGVKGDTGAQGVKGWISRWSEGDTKNVPYAPINDRHSDYRHKHNNDDFKGEEGEHGKIIDR